MAKSPLFLRMIADPSLVRVASGEHVARVVYIPTKGVINFRLLVLCVQGAIFRPDKFLLQDVRLYTMIVDRSAMFVTK